MKKSLVRKYIRNIIIQELHRIYPGDRSPTSWDAEDLIRTYAENERIRIQRKRRTRHNVFKETVPVKKNAITLLRIKNNQNLRTLKKNLADWYSCPREMVDKAIEEMLESGEIRSTNIGDQTIISI